MLVFLRPKEAAPWSSAPSPKQAAQFTEQGATPHQAFSKHLISEGEKQRVSEPGEPCPASSCLPVQEMNVCGCCKKMIWSTIKYSFLIITCSFLIYKLLLKRHNNILKIFQVILVISTEMTELKSLLLINVVSHIMGRNSLFFFFLVYSLDKNLKVTGPHKIYTYKINK